MPLPNFVLAGTPKSGSTSLFQYLDQHPQVYFSPIKEPKYFAFDPNNPDHVRSTYRRFPVRTLEEYRDLFDNVGDELAIGDGSVAYFNYPFVPARIEELIPDARLIFILRDPVERLYSRFTLKSAKPASGRLDVYDECRPGGTLSQQFLYAPYFKHWLESFKRGQMVVVLLDDLKTDPIPVVQSIFRHLEIDDHFEPDTSRSFNVGGVPNRSAATRTWKAVASRVRGSQLYPKLRPFFDSRYYKKPSFLKGEKAAPMPQDLVLELREYYKNDVLELEKLMEIDLSAWGYQS